MVDRVFSNWSVFVLAVVFASVGCQTLHNAGVPGLEPYLKPDPIRVEELRNNKEKFAIHHDHTAFFWLLSQHISNGMLRNDVEEILGGTGEPTSEFNHLKSDGLYHATDLAYKWGPDSTGNSAVLFFRDGRVVNFNPKDYRDP